MALTETRIRSLETARECVALGACQRTVCWITGLPEVFIRHRVFGTMPPRRGRPPYSDELLLRAPPALKAQLAALATSYRRLRDHGFHPPHALLTAYRHRSGQSFSFDEAFYLVSNLDGIWACTTSTLSLCSCRRCHFSHLIPQGFEAPDNCPMCVASRSAPLASSRLAVSTAEPDKSAAVETLERLIVRARYEKTLEALGAHPRIVHALSKIAVPLDDEPRLPVRISRRWNQRKGRPINLVKWNGGLRIIVRVQYAMLAIVYRRLRHAGVSPESALQTAYRQARAGYSDACAITFDRAFEVVSLFDGRWDAQEALLYLTRCADCGSLHLVSKLDASGMECPFCCLLRNPALYQHACARRGLFLVTSQETDAWPPTPLWPEKTGISAVPSASSSAQ